MTDEWVMVPMDPTPEMVTAGREGRAAPFNPTRDLWRAMLAAAPAAPQQAEWASNETPGEVYKRGYEEALNDCIRNGGEAWARSMFANNGEHIKPQQAEPVAWPAGHRWARNMAALESQSESDPTAPIIAPQQAEPVTTVTVHLETGGHAVSFDALYFDLPVGEHPLYLHPPADEVQRLRDAALAVLQEYNAHGGLRPSAMNPLINELRRALEGK